MDTSKGRQLFTIDHDLGHCPSGQMARFLIKGFDTEAVVFDIASGDTHYLSPLAYTLLSQAQSGMVSQDISAGLAGVMQVEQGIEFDRLANESISSLQRIGLLGQA